MELAKGNPEQVELTFYEGQIQLSKNLKIANEFPIAKYEIRLVSLRLWFVIASSFVTEETTPPKHRLYKYRFSGRELAQSVNISTDKGYTKDIDDYLQELLNTEIFIPIRKQTSDESGKWIRAHFFSSVSFEDGYFDIIIDPNIHAYFFDLKNRYSLVEIQEILSMTSIHTAKIYLIIKQYINAKAHPPINIEELKSILSITGKYKSFADMRRFVLEPALKQINEKTSIKASFTTDGRRGKKATVISFTGIYKKTQVVIPLSEEQEALVGALKFLGVKAKAATDLVLSYTPTHIRENISYVQTQSKVKNKAAYLIAAIKADYFSAERETAATREANEKLYIHNYQEAIKTGNTSAAELWKKQLKELNIDIPPYPQ